MAAKTQLLVLYPRRQGLVPFFGIQPGIMADFRTRFGVPREWTPIGAVAIGYGDPGADRCRPRRRVSASLTNWCTAAGGDGFVQDLDMPSTSPVRSVSPSKAGTARGAPDPAPRSGAA
jgi:hypothetical protein